MALGVSNSKVLKLVFENQAGGSFTVSVNDPRENVTAAEAEAVMDTIIAANIFQTSGGDLVAKKDIKIVDQTVNDLYDPAEAE